MAGRILCVADIRGKISSLNDLVRDANATAVIHTGDFGFFESNSLARINDRTLKHLTMYTPLIPTAQRNHLLSDQNHPSVIRQTVDISLLSEFPLLLSGQIKLNVPVYTTWGACEDVAVLEKFRLGHYSIPNLHILDEANSKLLDVGGVKLRLFGLGGALVPHKLFDNGEGNATIAGAQGTMWTTALQIGELVDTAQRVYDPTETRLLVSHASPGREGILTQLALVTKVDLTVSAGLHFRYASSWNEFSTQQDFEGFRAKLIHGKEQFDRVWDSVKEQVDKVIDDKQRILLDKALSVVERIPSPLGSQGSEDYAWKNCWNWNLCDAAYGGLVLDVREGRVSAELKSQGFNYAYRRANTVGATPTSANSALPAHNAPPSKGSTPAPPAATTATPPPVAPTTALTNGNGAGSGASAPSPVPTDKQDRKKKEKKDKKKAIDAKSPADEVATSSTADLGSPATSSRVGAEPGDSSKASDDITSPKSPTTDGARTPRGSRAPRHPWTIHVRTGTATTEAQVREFFGDAKDGIIRVNYPVHTFAGRNNRSAFVEFGDEEAMKAGFAKHAETLVGETPTVRLASDKPDKDTVQSHGPRGGPGRGRGGRGGFAQRGFAAAGLTKGPKGNGGGDSPATPKGEGSAS